MTDLKVVALGDCVRPVKTWNPLKATGEDEFTYIDLSAVDQERKQIVEARNVACSEAPSRARQLVEAGDVLVSTVRPNLNGVALVGVEHHGATASTGFCVLRPTADKLDGGYAFQWVKSPSFVADMVSKATGASYPAVSDRIVLESRLPLPPLPEQRRIAAILDQADALRAKRRESLAQLDSLTQALFVEMTQQSSFGVRRMRLEDAMAAIIDYRGKTPTKTKSGVPLVTARVVKSGELLDPSEYIAEEDYKTWMRRGLPMAGDVLFTTEAPLGEVAQLDSRRVALAQRLLLLRGKPELLDNTYLKFALTSQAVKSQIEARATGSTVKGIRQSELREVEIPVPPLQIQTKFAGRIGCLGVLRKQLRASAAEMDTLFASLQHRAFAGQLS